LSNSDTIEVPTPGLRGVPGGPGPQGMPQRQGTVDQQPGGLKGAWERDPGRTSQVARGKGPAATSLLGAVVSWRPGTIYVASISAATEIGLGQAAHGGVKLRRVTIRVRTQHDPSPTAYWTFTVQRREADGTAYPTETFTTATTAIRANVQILLYDNMPGLRLEENHEVTVSVAKTGSPTALSGVMLYSDWYVGI